MKKYILSGILWLFVFGLIAATAKDSNIIGRLIVDDNYSEPTCATATGDGDACVSDACEANGALDVGGAGTLGSTVTVTGLGTLSAGTLSGFTDRATTFTASAANCLWCDASDDAHFVYTLPATTTVGAGCVMTLVLTAAATTTNAHIHPDASEYIVGSCLSATDGVTTQAAGTAGTDLELQSANQIKGDFVQLVSDGTDTWYIQECVGAWGI